jgi:uncharacterized protein YaiE (UPF0345 family)
MRLEVVAAETNANLYFAGKVISHTVYLTSGAKKTLGIIFPGEFYFGTQVAERMEITAGACRVKLKDSEQVTTYTAGQSFEVSAQSGFTIWVEGDTCQYVCSFLA